MIKESVWTIGNVNPKCPFKMHHNTHHLYTVDVYQNISLISALKILTAPSMPHLLNSC